MNLKQTGCVPARPTSGRGRKPSPLKIAVAPAPAAGSVRGFTSRPGASVRAAGRARDLGRLADLGPVVCHGDRAGRGLSGPICLSPRDATAAAAAAAAAATTWTPSLAGYAAAAEATTTFAAAVIPTTKGCATELTPRSRLARAQWWAARPPQRAPLRPAPAAISERTHRAAAARPPRACACTVSPHQNLCPIFGAQRPRLRRGFPGVARLGAARRAAPPTGSWRRTRRTRPGGPDTHTKQGASSSDKDSFVRAGRA